MYTTLSKSFAHTDLVNKIREKISCFWRFISFTVNSHSSHYSDYEGHLWVTFSVCCDVKDIFVSCCLWWNSRKNWFRDLILITFQKYALQNEGELLLSAFSDIDQKKRDILTIFTNHLLPLLSSFQITSIQVLKVLLTTDNIRKRLKIKIGVNRPKDKEKEIKRGKDKIRNQCYKWTLNNEITSLLLLLTKLTTMSTQKSGFHIL